MTAQGFNSNSSSSNGGSKDYIQSMRERRLMHIGKQSIKYPPIIVTKLNPPQTILLDRSPSNESTTAQVKILDFKDFPKIKLKGKYKK